MKSFLTTKHSSLFMTSAGATTKFCIVLRQAQNLNKLARFSELRNFVHERANLPRVLATKKETELVAKRT
jgi:hypothetical protein